MKYVLKPLVTSFLLAVILISCQKESLGDFMPLTIGAKYLYNLHNSYAESSTQSHVKEGICEWTFTSLNTEVDTVRKYTVQQVFNGTHIYHRRDINTQETLDLDTIIIENELSEVTILEYDDGKIIIDVPSLYTDMSSSFHRYWETSHNEICSPDKFICLRRDVGIKYLNIMCFCIHNIVAEYTLIKGPY